MSAEQARQKMMLGKELTVPVEAELVTSFRQNF